MNQLGNYRHRLTLQQQWRCTQLVRSLSAVLFTLATALLILMFGFAFMQTPDVITCRSLPSNHNPSLNRQLIPFSQAIAASFPDELISSLAGAPTLTAADDLSSTAPSLAAQSQGMVNSLPLLWPPKVLQTMHCIQLNDSDWNCAELFSSAAQTFLHQLHNISLTTSQRMNWSAIQQTARTWYKSPMQFNGEWIESRRISSGLLSFHMMQLRRSNYQYGFRLHCSHSYQALDNLFDCHPPVACEYKLFALLHLAVFQLGVAWFACGSLSLRMRAPPEVRFQQLRRDKHLLNTVKHAQALLLLVNSFCFLVHGLVPLATPLLYAAVYYLHMKLSIARLLSISIIVLQYILFIICGVVLRSL